MHRMLNRTDIYVRAFTFRYQTLPREHTSITTCWCILNTLDLSLLLCILC